MSEENVEVVRQPITLRARTRRRLQERLALRSPSAMAFLARAVFRFSPRSRLRQAFIRRTVQLVFESLNRDDFEAAFALYGPDVERIVPQEMVTLGVPPAIRGREEVVRFERNWNTEWGGWRFGIEEAIDLGDRLLMVGRVKATGSASGAGVDSKWATLVTISAGRVTHEESFFDPAEALEAAGLSA